MNTEPKKEEGGMSAEQSRAMDAAISDVLAIFKGRSFAEQRDRAAAAITIGLRHLVLLTAMPKKEFLDFAAGTYDQAVASLPPTLRDILGLS